MTLYIYNANPGHARTIRRQRSQNMPCVVINPAASLLRVLSGVGTCWSMNHNQIQMSLQTVRGLQWLFAIPLVAWARRKVEKRFLCKLKRSAPRSPIARKCSLTSNLRHVAVVKGFPTRVSEQASGERLTVSSMTLTETSTQTNRGGKSMHWDL